jgi:hypothetical protein
MRSRRPSLNTIIASLALFFALGGTAIAAQHYLITSTSQIKPSVLAKLKGNAGHNGAPGPQGPAGPSGSQGPAGPAGAKGLTGSNGERGLTGLTGERGPAGPSNLSTLTLEEGPENRVPAYNEVGPGGDTGVEGSVATCPAGQHVVSGGSDIFAGVVEGAISVPSEDHDSWIVAVANDSTDADGVVQAIAYCAGAGEAVAARVPSAAHTRAVKEADRLVAKLAAQVKASKR